MAFFFAPFGIQPLKEKLKVLVKADTALNEILYFVFMMLVCVHLIFRDEVGVTLTMMVCVTSGYLWLLELFLVDSIRSLLIRYEEDGFRAYYFVRIFLLCLIMPFGIFALCGNNLIAGYVVSKETLWSVPYYFLVGLISFHTALIPYRIYELILVIYFHYLSKKNQNPEELEDVVVEIKVPPPPSEVLITYTHL